MFDSVKNYVGGLLNPVYEYQISIGLNDKDEHRQLISEDLARAFIGSKFAEGCTIYRANGFYCGESEKSLIVFVYAAKSKKDKILQAAEDIRYIMNQEKVIVNISKAKNTFWIG